MVTSDHNMTGLENGENSSEPTLKKQPVRIVNLIQTEEGMEKENWNSQKSKMGCVCMIIVCSIGVLQKVIVWILSWIIWMTYIWCIKENATYMRKLRNFENKNANYEIFIQ